MVTTEVTLIHGRISTFCVLKLVNPVFFFTLLCIFVLIFVITLLTTEFEGLPSIPLICTGSLQGRIDLQGVPCKLYRVWVCSVNLATKQ